MKVILGPVASGKSTIIAKLAIKNAISGKKVKYYGEFINVDQLKSIINKEAEAKYNFINNSDLINSNITFDTLWGNGNLFDKIYQTCNEGIYNVIFIDGLLLTSLQMKDLELLNVIETHINTEFYITIQTARKYLVNRDPSDSKVIRICDWEEIKKEIS